MQTLEAGVLLHLASSTAQAGRTLPSSREVRIGKLQVMQTMLFEALPGAVHCVRALVSSGRWTTCDSSHDPQVLTIPRAKHI